MGNVHLYSSPAYESDLGPFDTIQLALDEAKEDLSKDYKIVCDDGYTGGETQNVSGTADATLQINGTAVNFGSYSLTINGQINLIADAKILSVDYLTSEKNGIGLAASAEVHAYNNVSANGNIELKNGAEMIAGSTIYASGDIELKDSAKMIAGSTIWAASDIVAGTGAKMFIGNTSSDPSFEDVGITLEGSDSTMIAGSKISTVGTIEVRSGSKIVIGGIDPAGVASGSAKLGANTALIAGTTIAAAGDIDLAAGSRLIIGIDDPGAGVTGIKIVGDKDLLSAGGSITAAGTIDVGSGSTISVGDSGNIDATGANSDIVLGENAEMIAGGTIGASRLINIGSGAKAFIGADHDDDFSGIRIRDNQYVAGASIGVAGTIDVGSGSTIKATNEIKATGANGDIVLDDSAEMIAGSTISASGTIDVGTNASIMIGSIDSALLEANDGDILLGTNTALIAGGSIATAGDIDLAAGSRLVVGATDPGDEFAGIKLESNKKLIADGSVSADGKIDVGSGSTISVGGNIDATGANGDIVLSGESSEIITGGTIGASRLINIGSGAKAFIGADHDDDFSGGIRIRNDQYVAGGSITVAGKIDVAAGTIEATNEIKTTGANGNIVLDGDSAEMIAGSKISAAGTIDVGRYASIMIGSIDPDLLGDNDGDILLGTNTALIAGGSIATAAEIDLATGSRLVVGATDPGVGFAGIKIESGKKLIAGGSVSAAGKIDVGDDATFSAGSYINTSGAIGDIIVGESAEMIVGNTIGATGILDIKSDAKVLVHADDPSTEENPFTGIRIGNYGYAGGTSVSVDGTIDVECGTLEATTGGISTTGDILLISGWANSVARTSISADGKIDVGTYATVLIGSLDSQSDLYNNGNIVLGEDTSLIAGTSISAARYIDLAAGSRLIVGATDPGDEFAGIKIESGKKLIAGSSICTIGAIEVESNATMIAGSTICATGDIEIKSGAKFGIGISEEDAIAGIKIAEGQGMVAHGAINVNGQIQNGGVIWFDEVGATLSPLITTTGGLSGGIVEFALGKLGSDYTDDLYLLVNGAIDDETVDIHVNGDGSPLDWADIKAGNYRFGQSSEYTLLASDEDNPTKLYLIKDTASTLYVNSTYSSTSGIWTDDGHLTGYNAFNTVAATIKDTTTALIVTGGNFTTSNAPTFEGIDTTIMGGVFSTSVCGGTFFTDSADSPTGSITLAVQNTLDKLGQVVAIPTFNKIFFAGDRIDADSMELTRYGDITTTISGGVFNNSVAGAMAFTGDDLDSEIILSGSVYLTISGGVFNAGSGNRDWIYGGCISTTKENAVNTIISENVTVTLDASGNNVTVGNVVVGSYGGGIIEGNATLVLTGDNNVTATGEIWGGCSSDKYTTTKKGNNRLLHSSVDGERILSFTGFNGTLTSGKNKIWAFRDVEVKENSAATIANSDAEAAIVKGGAASINLSDVINWTFEKDSSLSGNFINDFCGDTLNLKEFEEAGTYTLLISDSDAIFNGFGDLEDIRMGNTSVISSASYSGNAWTWSDNAFTLAITDVEINEQTFKAMQFTIA